MQIEDLAKVVDGLSNVVADFAKEMRDGFKKMDDKMDKGFKEVREEMDGGFKSVREEIHEVLEAVNEHSSITDVRLDRIEVQLDSLSKTVTNLPDKNYVDEKIGSLRGEVVTIARETALRTIGAQ